jgi:Ca2+-binding EF-hand superfamily protein
MMKKLFKSIPFVLVSFLGVTSVSVLSTELPARGPIPFANYDRDGNGFISEQEFTQVRSERMAAKATKGRPMKGARNAPSFVAFDEDQDGQLTAQELKAGQQAQMQNRRGNLGESSNKGQGRGKGGGMGKNSNMPSFSKFDMNGDGVILEEEFYEARAVRIAERVEQGYPMRNIANPSTFADIDTNGNAEISSKEFAEHQMKHRKK